MNQTPAVINPRLPPPEAWSIQAKLGIRDGENSGSVTLNWQQRQRQYVIRVQGVFGQGNAIIHGNEQYIAIERPGEPSIFSDDPSVLMRQAFGWDLPIASFNYWVRGLQSPEYPVDEIVYDSRGRIVSLKQEHWTLDYIRYALVAERLLPAKIRLEYEEAQLTLIIRKWQIFD